MKLHVKFQLMGHCGSGAYSERTHTHTHTPTNNLPFIYIDYVKFYQWTLYFIVLMQNIQLFENFGQDGGLKKEKMHVVPAGTTGIFFFFRYAV